LEANPAHYIAVPGGPLCPSLPPLRSFAGTNVLGDASSCRPPNAIPGSAYEPYGYVLQATATPLHSSSW